MSSSKVKVVDLDFFCDVDDGNSMELLDLRVTQTMRRNMNRMVINDLINPLHVMLNSLIQTSLGSVISQDLGEQVVSVQTFDGTNWATGGGGLHERTASVTVTLQQSGSGQVWEFPYAGGSASTARVRVRAAWISRSITS